MLHEDIFYQDEEKLLLSQYIPSVLRTEMNGVHGEIMLLDDPLAGPGIKDSDLNRLYANRPALRLPTDS